VAREPAAAPTADALMSALRQLLPEYMVPTQLLAVDSLPLSANGKVDRKAIAAHLINQASARVAEEPPRPGLEREVADIWKKVLLCDALSRTDDFFLIGGDSLRATQIVQLLQSQRISPFPVPLFVLFSNPTVAALSRYIQEQWQALSMTKAEMPIEEGIL
ncbi:MAG: hypothetical protein II007_03115, partial [Gammaproteobacteria bacterium]|nr:hypothetical protein [Gammaproteobacteria bacterium]